MAVIKRYVKHKGGTKKGFYYSRVLVPLKGEKTKSGRQKYKQVWRSIGPTSLVSKAQAQIVDAQYQDKLVQGKLHELIGEVPSLSEFTVEYFGYVKDTIAKRSWRRDRISLSNLAASLGDLKLSALSPKDIQDYQKKRLADGLKPATINRELACLKNLFNVAKQRQKFRGENPVSKVRFLEENNLKDRVLTEGEEDRLLKELPPHLVAVVQTALHTAMRKSEVLTLRWEDVNLEAKYILIEATNTKSKKMKKIPINRELRTILHQQKLKTGYQEFVFLTPKGKPYKHEDSLKGSFHRALLRADIAGVTFHTLRHTAATRMLEGGATFYAVVRMLGHSDPKLTMRYAHPDASLIEAAETLARRKKKRRKDISPQRHKGHKGHKGKK